MTGISRSQVSSICRGIDERVQAFMQRPLEGEWLYLWLDVTYVKVRQSGLVVSVAVIIACAVNSDGRREIIGMGIGESEAKAFRLAFLLSLKERDLEGLKLVISDAHSGLKAAIQQGFCASWQRCRVHFMRKVLSRVNKSNQSVSARRCNRCSCRPTRKAPTPPGVRLQGNWKKARRRLRR